ASSTCGLHPIRLTASRPVPTMFVSTRDAEADLFGCKRSFSIRHLIRLDAPDAQGGPGQHDRCQEAIQTGRNAVRYRKNLLDRPYGDGQILWKEQEVDQSAAQQD